jgi:hypothetical protein
MGLKSVSAAVICTVLLGWSGLSAAEEYRPEEFLSLDLSKALLSPKRLGPEARFAPLAIEAKTDRANTATHARAEPRSDSKSESKVEARAAAPRTRVAQHHAEKPHGAARAKLARRHGNPLDAQASDTRVQVWPCKSGGICNWK